MFKLLWEERFELNCDEVIGIYKWVLCSIRVGVCRSWYVGSIRGVIKVFGIFDSLYFFVMERY